MFRATLAYIFISVYLLVMSPIGMAWTILSKDTAFIYRLGRFCVRTVGWHCLIQVRIEGREKIVPGQNYVFLSNHQGNIDGPVLLHSIPRDFRALVKKEMMEIPILSMVMKLVGFVPIDRTDPVKARASIDKCATLLKSGHSFIAFPEGTRSKDGQLGVFKKGVFHMALKGRVPIVPITINHSLRIQPPGAYSIRPGTVEVIFHDPIPTRHLTVDQRDRLMQETRQAIESRLVTSRLKTAETPCS